MNRRSFLTAAAVATLPGISSGAARRGPSIPSDVGRLVRVVIHRPGKETQQVFPRDDADLIGREQDFMDPDGPANHRRLVEILTIHDAEVLSLDHLLDEALARCAEAGHLGSWVQTTLPHLPGRERELSSAVLVGAHALPAAAVDAAEGAEPALAGPLPAIPMKCLFFTRDPAVATPRGVVIGHFANENRALEPDLVRFAFDWSPTLASHRVAFIAEEEDLLLQGGDVIVEGERTLLVGVGNLTEIGSAQRLARALGMDVIAVRLPGPGRRVEGSILHGWNPLRALFLHLDSAFGLLDDRLAVTVPYLFESKYSDATSMSRFARATRRHLGDEPWSDRELRALGRIQLFRARTGKPDRAAEGRKLVDHLRHKGYELVFVGGPPPPDVDEDFLTERVIPELLAQAANVVALGPRRVIAYEGNPHTTRTLNDAGVRVETISKSGLAQWHGGPHCMTMPLHRHRVP